MTRRPGGWPPRRAGVPLAARVRSPGEVPERACPGRHCWVGDPADGAGTKRPGLLVEWRVRAEDWEGRVVYVAALRPDTWALVEEWVPASLLTPM